jgi:hypothetical protein
MNSTTRAKLYRRFVPATACGSVVFQVNREFATEVQAFLQQLRSLGLKIDKKTEGCLEKLAETKHGVVSVTVKLDRRDRACHLMKWLQAHHAVNVRLVDK